MKPSEPKQKLNIEKICREYYESQIFGGEAEDKTSALLFFSDSSLYLERKDSSFKGMDFETFLEEIWAVNMELFGLGLLDYNNNLCQDYSFPESVLPESLLSEEIVFTKRYLGNTGRVLWDKMGFYNNLISEKHVRINGMFEHWGRFRDSTPVFKEEDELFKFREELMLNRFDRAVDMFSKHVKEEGCIERLVCRFMIIPCDISKITILTQEYSLKFVERLGLEHYPNQVGLFALQELLVGLYYNVTNYLDCVFEYGSYEEYKKARNDILPKMKGWFARRQA